MKTSRRAFVADTVKLGLGSLTAAAALPALARAGDPPSPAVPGPKPGLPRALPELPVRVYVQHDGPGLVALDRAGLMFAGKTAAVELAPAGDGLAVRVHCPDAPLARVILRWELAFPADTLFLGDAWERSYGDLQWRFLQPERVLPWYFAAHHPASGATLGVGVRTQPAAMCFWTVDAEGVSLWLDFRNGGAPSLPGDRMIAAATVVAWFTAEASPHTALSVLCHALCPAPRLATAPVCGNNNWYYAYGRDFDAGAMRRDATFLAGLATGHATRPFCVIDAGWTPGSVCPGGPWTEGDEKRFPDMPGLADDMKKIGVRPGIWMRPTALMVVDEPRRLRPGPCTAQEKPLDLSLPDNIALIRDDVARVRGWGYELIKHDFSTYDAFGRWGFEMGAELTDDGWHLADRTLTNAELLLRLYRTLREAAGDAVLLGCNTVGHLGAGIFEVQRTGDDTSGRVWERTRRMGVNTLAYRLAQNGAFFQCDADCAAHTADTPWAQDRQWLDLVARSGTALFVSVDPRTVTKEQTAAFRAAMQTALAGGEPGGVEPLDWLHTTTPATWRLGGETKRYDWEPASGAWPFRV